MHPGLLRLVPRNQHRGTKNVARRCPQNVAPLGLPFVQEVDFEGVDIFGVDEVDDIGAGTSLGGRDREGMKGQGDGGI